MTAVEEVPVEQKDSLRSRWPAIFFAGALVLMLAGIGHPPVNRTQEARVLETARQMLGTGWQGWMLPTLNGEPRLKKPPLAYWMSAAAYRVGTVGELGGRVPNALLGWVTLGATYWIIKRFSSWQLALASAAVLLGSYHFFRFMRLAETDAPATLFLTIAIGSLWIASIDPRLRWFHLAAIATALIILSKGAPAIFVLIFLIGFCAIEKRWDLFLRFIKSGALLTIAVIALPWFIYAARMQNGGAVFAGEIGNTLRGGDHFDSPVQYLPGLLIASAPWSAFLPLALFDAIRRWKQDPVSRVLLIWLAAIFLPLCVNGNKQSHYLLMLTPPMMMLIARLLLQWPEDLGIWVRRIFAGMLMVAFLAAFGAPMLVYVARGQVRLEDLVIGVLLLISATIIAIVTTYRRHILAGIFAMMLAVCVMMPVLIGYWIPSIPQTDSRTTANLIHSAFGDGPYVFYGENRSLPLCFNLRTAIPGIPEGQIEQATQAGTVVITQTKNGTTPPPLPAKFKHALVIKSGEQTFDLYKRFDP